MQHNTITCPNCHHEFDVEAVISGRLEAHFKAEYEQKLAQHRQQQAAVQKELEQQREQLQAAQADYDERVKADTDKALKKALKAELAKAVLSAVRTLVFPAKN